MPSGEHRLVSLVRGIPLVDNLFDSFLVFTGD
jgi:hypothetical protein